MSNITLPTFFDVNEIAVKWDDLWQGMPEFNQEDLLPCKQVIINFETWDDIKVFSKLLKQKITYKTPSVWFPAHIKTISIETPKNYRWLDES